MRILFFASAILIIYAMIGYPMLLLFMQKVIKPRVHFKNEKYFPTVTIMVVAHNEDKVIQKKLDNLQEIEYPKEFLNILVASDNSDDKTNVIVESFCKNNTTFPVTLYTVRERMGKTNAQNEAQKNVKSDILVMTDANAMLAKDSIKALVANFADSSVAYVCGKLCYTNENVCSISSSENTYWNLDLKMRKIESEIQTITAGNGALYACRNSEYHDFNPIECHDTSMPLYFALQKKRCIFDDGALAFEKAGESANDEFKRKVRMNRIILNDILPNIKILDVYNYRWFTFFYIGHRTVRYLLWLNHIILFLTSIILMKMHSVYAIVFFIHIVVFILLLLKGSRIMNNKLSDFICYYFLTVFAQFLGVINQVSGKSKPFWEKAESTR